MKRDNEAKQSKASHTATPWAYDGEYVFGREDNGLMSKKVIQVCNMSDSYNWQENAEFIVRAVNSYQAMLSALKNIRANIECLPEIISREGVVVGDLEAVESMKFWANEAIAQAEGK